MVSAAHLRPRDQRARFLLGSLPGAGTNLSCTSTTSDVWQGRKRLIAAQPAGDMGPFPLSLSHHFPHLYNEETSFQTHQLSGNSLGWIPNTKSESLEWDQGVYILPGLPNDSAADLDHMILYRSLLLPYHRSQTLFIYKTTSCRTVTNGNYNRLFAPTTQLVLGKELHTYSYWPAKLPSF